MAYIKADDNPNAALEGGDTTAAPVQKAGTSGGALSNAAPSGTGSEAGPATATADTGSFGNIKGYLNSASNRGADLAGKIGGYLDTSKASSDLNTAGSNVDRDIAAGGKISDTLQSRINAEDFSGINSDAGLATEFKNAYQGNYRGPNESAINTNLDNSIGDYGKKAANINSTDTLSSILGDPQRNRGPARRTTQTAAQNFDNQALQSAPAQEKIRDYQKNAQDLNDRLAALKSVSMAKVANAQGALGNVSQNLRNTLGAGGFRQNVGGRTDADWAKASALSALTGENYGSRPVPSTMANDVRVTAQQPQTEAQRIGMTRLLRR
jgi:hypothetical protein